MNNNYNCTGGCNRSNECGTCTACCEAVTRCYNTVLAVIGVLLAFFIGMIFGALFIGVISIVFAAVIAITVILAVMFVIFLILRYCNTNMQN